MSTQLPSLVLLFCTLFFLTLQANAVVSIDKHDATLPDLTNVIKALNVNRVNRQSVACGRQCKFFFCNGETDIIVGAPDVAASSTICKRDMGSNTVGVISRTGEARVSKPGRRPRSISQFRPMGLSQKFSRDFFKSFEIAGMRRSGIGHERAQGNQVTFLDGLCVKLPIKNYQILDEGGRLKNRMTTSDPRDCIAFQAVVPRILIELMWNSADDLDLHVFEPDGDRLSFRNTRTNSGVLLADDNTFVCGTKNEDGLERAVYAADGPVEVGGYSARAQHFNNCGEGATQWRIRVFLDGKMIRSVSGSSNLDGEAVIPDSRIRFRVRG